MAIAIGGPLLVNESFRARGFAMEADARAEELAATLDKYGPLASTTIFYIDNILYSATDWMKWMTLQW